METLTIKALVIACLGLAFYLVKKSGVFHLSPAAKLRRLLRARMRFRGTPRVCSRHSGVLKAGQMAILDSVKCYVCKKEYL